MAASAPRCICASFILLCGPAVCSAPLLCASPLCEYTTFNPSILLLRDIWVVSGLDLFIMHSAAVTTLLVNTLLLGHT